ncbi:hypothetical protein BJ875DRAFT_479888 [Amylocarpus encephaloides]|uniref:Uncharacterized protein n=1 Tax=Amylocarpus encephaloides TaxID=45428 RepID=A0A9P8C9N4_9HELO|nr:hypothetical protein BJ875DRAFT_479888 [Amylocarpus encephaloides]
MGIVASSLADITGLGVPDDPPSDHYNMVNSRHMPQSLLDFEPGEQITPWMTRRERLSAAARSFADRSPFYHIQRSIARQDPDSPLYVGQMSSDRDLEDDDEYVDPETWRRRRNAARLEAARSILLRARRSARLPTLVEGATERASSRVMAAVREHRGDTENRPDAGEDAGEIDLEAGVAVEDEVGIERPPRVIYGRYLLTPRVFVH